MSAKTAVEADLRKQLTEIEELLDHGSHAEARKRVQAVAKRRRFPRPLLAELAMHARMARLSELTIRLLHRHVRAASRSASLAATDEEIVQYASALDDFGASREAIALLAETRDLDSPMMLVQLGFAYMNVWEYGEAVAVLERLLRLPLPRQFSQLSSRVNLAEALIMGPEDHARARNLLEEVLAASSGERFRVLHKRALLLLVQSAVLRGDAGAARGDLERLEAGGLVGDEDEFDSNVLLWKAAAALLGTARPAAVAELREARRRLEERRAWEKVRLCELFGASGADGRRADQELLRRLYFGTPYPDFRARVARAAGGEAAFPERYEWEVPRAKTAAARESAGRPVVLDARTGAVAGSHAKLKVGQSLQRLLAALASDFYKPKTLTALHERVFIGSSYDPRKSPDRVHQLLRRFRAWLKARRIPLAVDENQGEYRLVATGPCRIVIHRAQVEPHRSRPPVSSNYFAYLERLRGAFATRDFGVREAAAALTLAQRAAGKYLKAACEEGVLARQGQGPRTRYRFR